MAPGTAQGSHHVVEQQQPAELVQISAPVGISENLIYICQGSFVSNTMQEYFINTDQSASFNNLSPFFLP